MDEVLIRGRLCPRVDLGNSMRLTIIDVSAVPDVQVRHHSIQENVGPCILERLS